MRTVRPRCALVLVLLFGGCAADTIPSDIESSDDHSGASRALHGGTPTLDRPEIVAILARFPAGGTSLCTGALVAPRVVLTAAHCMSQVATYEVYFHFPAPGGRRTERVDATVALPHDDYLAALRPGSDVSSFDLGLLLLGATPAGVTPLPLAARGPARGDALTLWGYGATGTGMPGDGQKRTGDAVVQSPDAGHPNVFGWASAPGATALCPGDSGGPILWEEDGDLVVGGVNHIANCANRADGDTYRSFGVAIAPLRGWIESRAARMAGPGERSFTAVTPRRIMDTRAGLAGPALDAAADRSLRVVSLGGIPTAGATAVALNVTVTGPTASGWVSVYPGATAWPGTSSLNFDAGETIANSLVVPVGPDGTVAIRSTGPTHLVVDLMGFFGHGFRPIAPFRALDSRAGAPFVDGEVREVDVAGGAPDIVAAAVNLTSTEATAPGWVAAFPAGTAWPGTSSMNFAANDTIANALIVPVHAGRVSILQAGGPSHVLVDVMGLVDGSGGFHPSVHRVIDTRSGIGRVGALGAFEAVNVNTTHPAVQSFVVNITATQTAEAGFLSAFPYSATWPGTSSINFVPGQTIANGLIVGTAPNPTQPGSRAFRVLSSSAGTHVLVDTLGWFE